MTPSPSAACRIRPATPLLLLLLPLLLLLARPAPGAADDPEPAPPREDAAAVRALLRDGTILPGPVTLDGGTVEVGGRALPREALRKVVFDRAAAAQATAGESGAEAAQGRRLDGDERAEFELWNAQAEEMASRNPDANYLVLLDRIEHRLRGDGTRESRSRYILKVRKEQAKQFARLVRWFVEGRSRVSFPRARCLKPGGLLLEMDPASPRVSTPATDASTFIKYQMISGMIPGVEIGDILDIEVLEEETNPFKKEFWFPQMYFQSAEPARRADALFAVPEAMRLHFTRRNIPDGAGPHESVEGGERIYRFALENLPPYVAEPLDPDYADITPFVQASLFRGWKPVTDWVGAMWAENARPSEKLAAATRELVKGCRTDAEKVAAIYHYVQREIRYVIVKGDMSTLWGSWPADTIRDQKFGCCVDKAQVMSAMLAAAGIRSTPVAINAGARRLDPEIATLSITHAISRVELDGKILYLDSTGYNHRFPHHAGMNHGREAVVPELSGLEAVPLPAPEGNAVRYRFDMKFSPDGALALARRGVFTGDEEAMRRGYWKSVREDEYARVFAGVANELAPGAALGKFGVEHCHDLDGPFATVFDCAWNDYGKRAGDLLVVPLPNAEFDFPEAALAARKYPIQYESVNLREFVYAFAWEKGRLEPAFLPEARTLECAIASYATAVEPSGDGFTLTVRYTRSGTEVPVADYPAFREFTAKVARASREPLLFRVLPEEGGDAR